MRLTPDDLDVLRHVHRHRFLRSTHLMRLTGRPPKKLVERLGVLYHNQYLDRPRAQLDYFATTGSAPLVHALGNRGAAVLAEVDGIAMPETDWTDKNRTARRPFIEHQLLISDLMVAIEVAARRRPDVRLISRADILAAAPTATQVSKNPWKLRARVLQDGVARDAAVVPDAVFGLDFTTLRRRSYFFVEADRSTMPIMRKRSSTRTAFARKLPVYWHIHRTKGHAAHLGIGNFRVLTLAKSRPRIEHMIAAVKEMTGGAGSNLFLFTEESTLAGCLDALALDWTSGKGESVQLAIDRDAA
jgi:hypothetical protein